MYSAVTAFRTPVGSAVWVRFSKGIRNGVRAAVEGEDKQRWNPRKNWQSSAQPVRVLYIFSYREWSIFRTEAATKFNIPMDRVAPASLEHTFRCFDYRGMGGRVPGSYLRWWRELHKGIRCFNSTSLRSGQTRTLPSVAAPWGAANRLFFDSVKESFICFVVVLIKHGPL